MDHSETKPIEVQAGDEPTDTEVDETAQEAGPDEEVTAEAQDVEVAPGDEPAEAPTAEELQAEVESLQQALAEEHDRMLRAVAELRNYKRRVAREQQEKARYAGQSVLTRILPVMDNLQRILEHQADADSEEFARGIEMTVGEFFRVLDQLGVSVIDCEGEPFDPALHEAVAQVETDEAPEGTVVAVDTPGYCLHDRCLRPARVVVAKRPEAAESAS